MDHHDTIMHVIYKTPDSLVSLPSSGINRINQYEPWKIHAQVDTQLPGYCMYCVCSQNKTFLEALIPVKSHR